MISRTPRRFRGYSIGLGPVSIFHGVKWMNMSVVSPTCNDLCVQMPGQIKPS